MAAYKNTALTGARGYRPAGMPRGRAAAMRQG